MSSSSDTPPGFSGIPDDYWDWQIQFDAFLICKDINNLSEARPDAEAKYVLFSLVYKKPTGSAQV